jgi:Fe2+ transport system protein FeoA
MDISLDRLCLGQKGIVTHINTENAMKNRLRVFGMVPGTSVCCRYQTPGGSVTALEFRGTVVAMRTKDLKKIRVEC